MLQLPPPPPEGSTPTRLAPACFLCLWGTTVKQKSLERAALALGTAASTRRAPAVGTCMCRCGAMESVVSAATGGGPPPRRRHGRVRRRRLAVAEVGTPGRLAVTVAAAGSDGGGAGASGGGGGSDGSDSGNSGGGGAGGGERCEIKCSVFLPTSSSFPTRPSRLLSPRGGLRPPTSTARPPVGRPAPPRAHRTVPLSHLARPSPVPLPPLSCPSAANWSTCPS